MTDYAPSLVVLLEKTALKHVEVSVVGSLGMITSYGSYTEMYHCGCIAFYLLFRVTYYKLLKPLFYEHGYFIVLGFRRLVSVCWTKTNRHSLNHDIMSCAVAYGISS